MDEDGWMDGGHKSTPCVERQRIPDVHTEPRQVYLYTVRVIELVIYGAHQE